mgnify:CR=1 FL=1
MNDKRCFLCGRNDPSDPLERHHILGGANRKKSEKYGLVVYLCGNRCHRNGRGAVHKNGDQMRRLRRYGQLKAMEEQGWTEEDFRRILTQPENALIKQYQALMAVDDVELSFTPDALDEMAHIAVEMNDSRENIGARRLHTLIEELLDEVAFSGGENGPEKIEIDGKYVREHLSHTVQQFDVSKQII